MKTTQHYSLTKYDYKKDSTIDFVTGMAGVGNSSNMDKIDTALKELADTKSNKNHLHVKSEVGLGQVENYPVATSKEALEGTATDKYMTPALVTEAIKYGGANVGPQVTAVLKREVKSVYVELENQKEVMIPLDNFNAEVHHFELRVGGVPFFHERYTVEENKIVLKDNEIGFSEGKRIDFVFYYLEQVGDNRLPIHGNNLHDGSVTQEKLSKELIDVINKAITDENLVEIHEDIAKKADIEHSHDDYSLINHEHDTYANIVHEHDNYAPVIHEHDVYSEKGHTHDNYADTTHTHDSYADVNHASSHLPGGDDALIVNEEMLSEAIKNKLNYVGSGGVSKDEIDQIKDSILGFESKVEEKADSIHTHTDLAIKSEVDLSISQQNLAIMFMNETLESKASKLHNHDSAYAPASHVDDETHFRLISNLGTSGTNLNNIKATGRYNQAQNANALTTLNYPVQYAGHMTVYAEGHMTYQFYHAYNGTGCWYRSCYMSNWYEWKKLSDVGHTHTIDEISGLRSEIDSLKSSVSSGKSSVATAITSKGVASTSSDSFATMATKIGKIQTKSSTSFEKCFDYTTVTTSGVYPNLAYDGDAHDNFVATGTSEMTIQTEGSYRICVTYLDELTSAYTFTMKVYVNGTLKVTDTQYVRANYSSNITSSRFKCAVGDKVKILLSSTKSVVANYGYLCKTIN